MRLRSGGCNSLPAAWGWQLMRGRWFGRSPHLCMLAAQNKTSRVGLRNLLAILVGYFTLDIADVLSAIDYTGLRSQPRLPHRTEEMDTQRHGGEGFTGRQRRREGHAHGRIGQVAQHAAVKSAHGVGMLRPCLEYPNRATAADLFDVKANQFRDGRFGSQYFLDERMRTCGSICRAFVGHVFPLWIGFFTA